MSNAILQLRGIFNQKRNSSRPGPPSLPAQKTVSSKRVEALRNSLVQIQEYWESFKHDYKPLVAIRYERIIAKSGRVRRLLSESESSSSNNTIVGVRFYDNGKFRQHVITHCVSKHSLKAAIKDLYNLALCIDKLCGGEVTSKQLKKINEQKTSFDHLPLSRSAFSRLVVDVCHIECFELNVPEESVEETSMVTLYKGTGINNTEFLRKIGISELNLRTYDESTYLLTPDQYKLLYNTAPQLIAMAIKDINEIPRDEIMGIENDRVTIPSPSSEPWIGVFDTPFNNNVYFSDWVKATVEVDSELIVPSDYSHGTGVSSIIVDGPSLNPEMDDGCGRFRVRHVGIAADGKFSSFTIIREIEKAIIKFPEIKVWNLSLGSLLECPENFVSVEASVLDRIQVEHDVIFVIAGTNDKNYSKEKRVGAPADSVNSLVVNSVRMDGSPCSYSRKGPVLSFFGKPDVCYYGGDKDQPICVCQEPDRTALVSGTSFAAPWISRKLAYLIHIVGFSREIAKALIIDSAGSWKQSENPCYLGYGAVPKRIKDILSTSDNEIKFVLSGTSELFDTYTHNIPVPVVHDKHPYYAKATLCYFPHCERSQGVDYTSTEISITFGRLNGEKIQPIDNNIQDLEGSFTYEEEARKFFRKWDNVKHIAEEINPKGRGKKSYENGLWGISLKTKERLDESFGENMRFGLVVTLHAIDGVNRIDEFIQRCSFRAWIVNKINIETQVNIFNEAELEIEFE